MDHTIEQSLNDASSRLRDVSHYVEELDDAPIFRLAQPVILDLLSCVQRLTDTVRRIATKQHMLSDEASWRF